MTSLYEKICSEEKVGTVVEDAASPLYGTVPVAPVICAQLEVITFSTLQRPLKERVLKALENMLRANDRRNWLTIYLTLFILLHSCSMTTFRDAEWARQMNYPVSVPRLQYNRAKILMELVDHVREPGEYHCPPCRDADHARFLPLL